MKTTICIGLLTLAGWLFPVTAAAEQDGFGPPERVYIDNLPPGSRNLPISTEEPYISRDGQLLFFNSGSKEGNKDLHYARLVAGRWVYQGEVGNVNSPGHVQGTASMDDKGNFYYVDVRAATMLRTGRLDSATVSVQDITDFTAAPKRRPERFRGRIHGNMDIEAAPDGSMVIFSRATWGWDGRQVRYIQAANLLISLHQGDGFVFDLKESDRLLQNINTDDLEYAAALTEDGKELFFTRLSARDLATLNLRSRIMRATRNSRDEPFGTPRPVEAIGGENFVEGPSLTADGRTLYYHQKVGKKFGLFRVSRPASGR